MTLEKQVKHFADYEHPIAVLWADKNYLISILLMHIGIMPHMNYNLA